MGVPWAQCPHCPDGGDTVIVVGTPPVYLLWCRCCRRRFDREVGPCPAGGHDWVEYRALQGGPALARKCRMCGERA